MTKFVPFGLIEVVAVLLFAPLAACSTPKPVVRTETVEVKVPVTVYPVYKHQVPVPPTPLPARPADARDALDVAVSKWCEAVAYMLVAQPLLQISSGQAPGIMQTYPECED